MSMLSQIDDYISSTGGGIFCLIDKKRLDGLEHDIDGGRALQVIWRKIYRHFMTKNSSNQHFILRAQLSNFSSVLYSRKLKVPPINSLEEIPISTFIEF